ncbi:MAG: DNRLRE domain-containing protein, partial [Acidimicrobiia bacterium]
FDTAELKGREIMRAELRLTLERAAGEGTIQFAAAGLREKWTEAEVNFANQPPRGATVGESIISLGSDPGEVTIQVTSLLKQTLEAGEPLEGIALSGPFLPQAGITYERVFRSREQGEGAPKLIVVHREKKKAEPAESAAGAGGVRIAIVIVIVVVLAVLATFFALRARRGGESEPEFGGTPTDDLRPPTSGNGS